MKFHIWGVAACITSFSLGAYGPSPRVRPAPTKYTVDMKASSETPPNPGNAGGNAKLTLSGNKLEYEIDIVGLSGPATMAHIHVGAIGVAGPPVYTFPINQVAAGKLAKGTVDLGSAVSKGVSGDSVKVLLDNGNAYINVHTTEHPKGEIRGQVVRK
jgi:hypothetical protein